MAKSLVTGGAGFIGTHVTISLIEMGHEVVVLDDLSGGFVENVHSKAKFINGSINDYDLLKKIFEEEKFDYVYHLAAYAAEGLSHFIKRFNYTNNVIGSVNLINLSVIHKIKCFVFTSSIAVYGKGQLPMREDLAPMPEDSYGIAKYSIELDLKATHEMFGLNYIVFRPHNVYGEFQNIGDRYRNVVGIFMNQLMQGKSLTVFGDGEQTRAFSYIGDVAPYIAKSVTIQKAYNDVFNIGGDVDYSVKQLANEVMSAMDMKQPLRYLEARNEVTHAYSDHSKIKEVFGINERNYVPLADGIRKMANWAKSVGIKKSDKFENIEILEKLPKVWLEE
jgi:UDP-glucose 4-epimerase